MKSLVTSRNCLEGMRFIISPPFDSIMVRLGIVRDRNHIDWTDSVKEAWIERDYKN